MFATVLYEDHRGPMGDYAFHKFVLSCVFDVVDGERYLLHHNVECRPMKGDSKLLKSVRNDVERISTDGRRIIAVFDNDHIRDCLSISATSSDEVVIRRILEGCIKPDIVDVVLIKQNIETIITAIHDCGPHFEPRIYQDAIKKQLSARDIMFNEAAKEERGYIRRCVLGRLPSLNELCNKIKACVDITNLSLGTPDI